MKTEELLKAYSEGQRNFTGADLTGADLRGADLRGADLTSAYLKGADLRGAVLIDAVLIDADLRDADLRDADLSDADLKGADLRDAKGIHIFNKYGGRTCYAVVHIDIMIIKAGCFWGTLDEFEAECKKKYPTDPVQAYEDQIAYLRMILKRLKP